MSLYKELWITNSATLSSHYMLSIVECYRVTDINQRSHFILILKPPCAEKKKKVLIPKFVPH